jgi:negative regulator of sigma E activity
MTDQIREQVSALLDGELARGELDLLVRRMERDAELKRTFASYVLAGEVLRSPGDVVASPGFAARISAAIDEGATTEAPAPMPVRRQRPRWIAPAFGTAVAASAAVAAVLLMRPPQADLSTARVQQDVPATVRPMLAANVVDEQEVGVGNPRLANYLVAHGQVANALGRRNVWSGLLAADPAIVRASYEVTE